MTLLDAASIKLDSAFGLINNAPDIATETRVFLKNQALIYANFLTAAIDGRLNESDEVLKSMVNIIYGFCEVVQKELGQGRGQQNERT